MYVSPGLLPESRLRKKNKNFHLFAIRPLSPVCTLTLSLNSVIVTQSGLEIIPSVRADKPIIKPSNTHLVVISYVKNATSGVLKINVWGNSGELRFLCCIAKMEKILSVSFSQKLLIPDPKQTKKKKIKIKPAHPNQLLTSNMGYKISLSKHLNQIC